MNEMIFSSGIKIIQLIITENHLVEIFKSQDMIPFTQNNYRIGLLTLYTSCKCREKVSIHEWKISGKN